MSKIIWIIVAIVIVGGGLFFFMDNSMAPSETEISETVPNEETGPENVPTQGGTSVGVDVNVAVPATKEFTVDASSFAFAPKTMAVNKGDTVKITVKNVGGSHDLKIDEFNAATRILKAGESQTITFVADKAGNFEYYCSVGNHRAMGMVGTLTVR